MANNMSVWLYSSNPAVYADATPYAINLTVNVGKSRMTDYYEPGTATISFNNYSRVFDPTNTSSPLYGYVKPKQRVVITQDGYTLFSGLVDDWAFTYDVSGQSVASLGATEKTSLFANQYFTSTKSFPSELSGARISRILADSDVAWPTGWGSQVIDAGTQMLDADTVTLGDNVLDYLRKIESSEQGQLFISGTDSLKFHDNSRSVQTSNYAVFADDNSTYISGGTIPAWKYDSMNVSYTTQLLFNRIRVTAWDGVSEAITNVPDSQSSYGLFQFNLDGVLYAAYSRLVNLASYIASKFSQPEYRFDSLRVNFGALTLTQQDQLLADVNLNGFAKVRFTPNATGSVIERYVRIIGRSFEADAGSVYVTYNLESIRNPGLVLDDSEFGKLDLYALGL